MSTPFPVQCLVCVSMEGTILWVLPTTVASQLYGDAAACGRFDTTTMPYPDEGPGLRYMRGDGYRFTNGNWAKQPDHSLRVPVGYVLLLRKIDEDHGIHSWTKMERERIAALTPPRPQEPYTVETILNNTELLRNGPSGASPYFAGFSQGQTGSARQSNLQYPPDLLMSTTACPPDDDRPTVSEQRLRAAAEEQALLKKMYLNYRAGAYAAGVKVNRHRLSQQELRTEIELRLLPKPRNITWLEKVFARARALVCETKAAEAVPVPPTPAPTETKPEDPCTKAD